MNRSALLFGRCVRERCRLYRSGRHFEYVVLGIDQFRTWVAISHSHRRNSGEIFSVPGFVRE